MEAISFADRLRLANHTTDFFVPMTGRSASLDPGPLFSPPASARHVPYTLAAPEILRLLDEAEQRADAAPYWLRYTALPEAEGDERWRATAGGPTVRIEGDGRGSRACAVGEEGAACAEDELGLQGYAQPAWLERLRFGKPMAIVEGHLDAFICHE